MNAQSPTVGEKLRNAREAQAINLLETAQALHIKVKYLQELESDHPELFHSMAQARGFLRLYASFLGLNARELIAQWEGQLYGKPIAAASVEPPSKEEVPPSTFGVPAEEITAEIPDEVEAEPDAEVEGEPPKGAKRLDRFGRVIASLGGRIIKFFSRKKKVSDDTDDAGGGACQAAPVQEPIPLQSSADIFREIGQLMHQRREHMELSMADVEHFTNLKRMYLAAIEEGRFQDLPSTVQGRGMLNNYAQFLGMEESAVIDRYAEALQRQREERLPPQRKTQPAVSVKVNTPGWVRQIINPDLLVGGALILVLFGFIIWGASRVLLGGEPEPTEALSISEMLQMTPSATPMAELTQTVEDNEVGEEATPLPGVAVAQPTATVVATVNAAPLQLYIITHDRAFVRITVDGNEVFNGRVLPEEVYTYSGENRIQLLTGNAAALEVYFNQNFLGELGDVGEVVDVDFSLEGLLSPTPQPTSISTPGASVLPEDETMMMEEDG